MAAPNAEAHELTQLVHGSTPPPQISSPIDEQTSVLNTSQAPEEGQTTPPMTTAQPAVPTSSSNTNAVNVSLAPTPTEDTCTSTTVQPMTSPSSVDAPHAEGPADLAVPKATVAADAPHAEGPADLAVRKATEVAEQSEVESQDTAVLSASGIADQPREEPQAIVTKVPIMAQVPWGDDSTLGHTPPSPDSVQEGATTTEGQGTTTRTGRTMMQCAQVRAAV